MGDTHTLDKAFKYEKAILREAKLNLAAFTSAAIKEETVQSAAIKKNKAHTLQQKVVALENRIKHLELIKSVKDKDEREELLNYFESTLKEITKDCEYVWSIVGSIEAIEKSNITFITDKHAFLKGKEVFSVLSDAFKCRSIEMVKLEDDIDNSILNKNSDYLWDLITTYEDSDPKPIFFLDLERLTPSQILFLGRLQKHFQAEKNALQVKIVVYTDDILISQLKTAYFQPDVTIEFEVFRMPCNVNYIPPAAPTYTVMSKAKEIKRIIEEAIQNYKKSFMRFDILIFLQSQIETDFVFEHALDLIKERINVVDLTIDQFELQLEPKQEELKQQPEENKPQENPPQVEPKVAVEQQDPNQPQEAAKEAEAVPVDKPEEPKVVKPKEEKYENIQKESKGNADYLQGEFNVIIAKSYKQIRDIPLDNVLILIDSGETNKIYYGNKIIEGIPTVSSKITREEALKRERLMGKTVCGEIYRLYSRKEFLRLQKRDFLNTLNFEDTKTFEEIIAEKCPETQALRILVHLIVNLSENWFSCSSEASAQVTLLWSRMGDIFSLANCIQSIPVDSENRLTCKNEQFLRLIQKNQVDPYYFDRLICDINQLTRKLLQDDDRRAPYLDIVGIIQKMDKQKLAETLQKIVIQKYYKNLCVYSGHRRHGYKHFASGQSFNYSEQNSLSLIQERPFLIIPVQLSINNKNKNQLEIKQCVAVDHMLFLETAPSAFVEQHKLRLLKRQSLNLHEIEYFGISTALFSYFAKNDQLLKEFEAQLNCYYEPNLHMDTITIHCDAAHKEKIEKKFGDMMEVAQKELNEEIAEFANGKNSIIKVEKGGIVKEVIILENEHEFYVDNLKLTVTEQELKELFSEYGEILKVRLFEGVMKDSETGGKTLSAEVLVADSEDSAFFVEVFDQNIFQGRNITVRNKNHKFQLKDLTNPTKYEAILKWNTWKSKGTATIEFDSESVSGEFMQLVANTLKIEGDIVKADINKLIAGKRGVTLKNLNKYVDEETIRKELENNDKLKGHILNIHVDRIPDLDRGTSKMRLTSFLKELFDEDLPEIKWIRRRENGYVESKVSFQKKRCYQINNLVDYNGGKDKLGQQKAWIRGSFSHIFNYDLKMEKILELLIDGNEQLQTYQKDKDITLVTKIHRLVPSKQEILIKIKSKNQDILDDAKYIIKNLLSPQEISIEEMKINPESNEHVDHTQIFTQKGQQKLKDIEEKYPVVFKVNLQQQKIEAYCSEKVLETVNKEIEHFLGQSIRVKIPVTGKNIRNILGTDGKGLEELAQKFELVKIELDYISKDVIMQGGAKQVDTASNALLALLEEKNSSAFTNNMPYSYEDCQVCSETISTGYRLQGCGHKFCVNCIMFVIENSLKDVNSFPIKCPCCSVPLVIRDIMAMMNEEQIEKMYRISLNKHVQTHFETLMICVGDNCRSVHSSALTKYTCYECKKTYCAKCSAEYHFGLTCTQYQETEAKNIEYLIKEGARKCPKCSVFIIRIDGCYRVECQRCNSHICWKDNCMKFYDNSSECYNHLDEMHGGYW